MLYAAKAIQRFAYLEAKYDRDAARLTFDRAGNGDMFVSGVAESFWETIYLVDRPGNYGWAIREGTHCYDRRRAFDRTDPLRRTLEVRAVQVVENNRAAGPDRGGGSRILQSGRSSGLGLHCCFCQRNLGRRSVDHRRGHL